MEKSIMGSNYGLGNLSQDLLIYLNLLRNGRLPLDRLITQRYRLEEINQGFKDLESGKNVRGVILF